MKIFITGGTGFIGKNLIKALAHEGNQIYFLIRDINKADIFSGSNMHPIKGKIEDVYSYQNIFNEGIELVYHLAAIPGQKWGFKKKDYYRLNTQATGELLKASHNKIRRFVFCSSINAASQDNKFIRDEYGESKWQAEQIVQKYHQAGLETVILRPAVVYGLGDSRGLMLKLCRLIKEKKFRHIGSGQNILPFVYINDLIAAFLSVKETANSGGIYEIIGPDSPAFKEVAFEIADILGVKISKFKIPVPLARLVAVLLEITFSLIKKEPLITQHRIDIITRNKPYNSLKAQNELNYHPLVNFKEGIGKTIAWYKENGYL